MRLWGRLRRVLGWALLLERMGRVEGRRGGVWEGCWMSCLRWRRCASLIPSFPTLFPGRTNTSWV